MIGFNQRLHPGLVLVFRANCNHVGIGRLLAFDGDCILLRVEAGGGCIIGVDHRRIGIIQRTRQLCGVELNDLDVLRVLGDVGWRDLETDGLIDLKHALGSQHQKRAATIGRVVRNADGCAILQLVQALHLLGVDTHWRGDGGADADDIELAVGNLVVEIGLVLEGVGLQLAIGQRLVRHDVIGEIEDFDIEALGRGNLLHLLHDLRMFGRGHADLDGFSQRAAGKEGCERSSDDELFHGCLLDVVISARGANRAVEFNSCGCACRSCGQARHRRSAPVAPAR